MPDATDGRSAAYFPFSTFNSTIEKFTAGIPNRIDKTIFVGQSGGTQNQLISGFKFLGLISEDLKPTESLKKLAVKDEGARKKTLEAILRDKYAAAFDLDLSKATPGELNTCFADSFAVEGDTKKKAIRFFLTALAHVGIGVSTFLKQPSANGGAPTVARRRGRPRKPPEITTTPLASSTGGSGVTDNIRTINLAGGGTFSVALRGIAPFDMSDDDREFVFRMLAETKKYGEKYVAPQESPTDDADEEEGGEP